MRGRRQGAVLKRTATGAGEVHCSCTRPRAARRHSGRLLVLRPAGLIQGAARRQAGELWSDHGASPRPSLRRAAWRAACNPVKWPGSTSVWSGFSRRPVRGPGLPRPGRPRTPRARRVCACGSKRVAQARAQARFGRACPGLSTAVTSPSIRDRLSMGGAGQGRWRWPAPRSASAARNGIKRHRAGRTGVYGAAASASTSTLNSGRVKPETMSKVEAGGRATSFMNSSRARM